MVVLRRHACGIEITAADAPPPLAVRRRSCPDHKRGVESLAAASSPAPLATLNAHPPRPPQSNNEHAISYTIAPHKAAGNLTKHAASTTPIQQQQPPHSSGAAATMSAHSPSAFGSFLLSGLLPSPPHRQAAPPPSVAAASAAASHSDSTAGGGQPSRMLSSTPSSAQSKAAAAGGTAASSQKLRALSSSALVSASSSSASGAASSGSPASSGQGSHAAQPVHHEWTEWTAAILVRNTLRACTGFWTSLAGLLGEPRVADRNDDAAASSSSASAGAVTHGLLADHSPDAFAHFAASPTVSALSETGKIEAWNAMMTAAFAVLSHGSERAKTALHTQAAVCLQAARGEAMGTVGSTSSAAAAAGPSKSGMDPTLTHWRVVPYAQGRCRCGVLSHPNASEQSPGLADLRGSLFTVFSNRTQPTFYSLSQVSELFHNELVPVQLSSEHNRLQLRPFGSSANAAASSSLDPLYCDNSDAVLRCVEALLMHDVETQTLLRGFGVRLAFRWIEPAAQGVSAAAVLDSAGLQVAWIPASAKSVELARDAQSPPHLAAAAMSSNKPTTPDGGSSAELSSVAPLPVAWPDVTCAECKQSPLVGVRFHCIACPDVDLCSACKAKGEHPWRHKMKQWFTPADISPADEQALAGLRKRGAPAGQSNGAAASSSISAQPPRAPQPSSSSAAAAAGHSSSEQSNPAENDGHRSSVALSTVSGTRIGRRAKRVPPPGAPPKPRILPVSDPGHKASSNAYQKWYDKWIRPRTKSKSAPSEPAGAAAQPSRDEDELSEGQVPNSPQDPQADADAAAMDDATAAESKAAASLMEASAATASPAAIREFALPDAILRGLHASSDGSSISEDEAAAAAPTLSWRTRPKVQNRTLPDFFNHPRHGRVERPVRGPEQTREEWRRRYDSFVDRGKRVWTQAELEAAQARHKKQRSSQAGAAASPSNGTRKSPRAAAGQRARSADAPDESSEDSSSSHDSDENSADDSAVLRSASGGRLASRSLPDFYIDPISRERVDRPVRQPNETSQQHQARYEKWRVRGRAVWTPADIEQAQQRRSQSLKQSQHRQNESPAAASSSSAAAAGPRTRSRSSPVGLTASGEAMEDDHDSNDSADSDRSNSEDGSDSESRGVRRVTRAPKRADAGADHSKPVPAPPSRRRRRSRASGKQRTWTRKPDFYIDSSGQRVHRPSRVKGELESEYQKKYRAWSQAGFTVWTQEELDAAAARGARGPQEASESGEDDGSDDEHLQSEDPPAAAAAADASGSRKHTPRRRSHEAASSAAAAAPSSSAAPNLQQLSLSSSNEVMSFLSQLMARFSGNQAAAGGANGAAPPFVGQLVGQLQAPASAAATAASASSHPPLDAMRDVDESDGAGGSSMPPLVDSHSSAAQSSHLERGRGAGSSSLTGLLLSAAAASSAAKGKRKADSHGDRSAAESDAQAGAAAAAAAAPSSDSPSHANKKSRPSAISTLQPVAFASHPQAAAAASSSGSAHASSSARLAAISTLELILAKCIEDPAKRAACLASLEDADITLDYLERNFSTVFPKKAVPLLVEFGLITIGPCILLRAIIQKRIELQQQAGEHSVECENVDGAASS